MSDRKARKAKLEAHVAAGTWVPKPPVGRVPLAFRVRSDLAPLMAADIQRGARRKSRVHNIRKEDT